jgi:hypothetical protein
MALKITFSGRNNGERERTSKAPPSEAKRKLAHPRHCHDAVFTELEQESASHPYKARFGLPQ